MKYNSSATNPDLDWSQVRETVNLLTLEVAQIEASLNDGDSSVNALAESFHQVAEQSAALSLSIEKNSNDCATSKALSDARATANAIENEIKRTIIAFQFYDRLSQKLRHVKSDLLALSELIGDPSRLYDPAAWRGLQEEIAEAYTTDEQRYLYEKIMQGSSVEDALSAYLQYCSDHDRKRNVDDNSGSVELF